MQNQWWRGEHLRFVSQAPKCKRRGKKLAGTFTRLGWFTVARTIGQRVNSTTILFVPWPGFRFSRKVRCRARRDLRGRRYHHVIPPVTGNGMSMAFESAELADAAIGGGVEQGRIAVERSPPENCFAIATPPLRVGWRGQNGCNVSFSRPHCKIRSSCWRATATGLWRMAFEKTR